MSSGNRFRVYVNGKWAGGSFGTRNEADAAAKTIRTSPDQSIDVRELGAPDGSAAQQLRPSPIGGSSGSTRK